MTRTGKNMWFLAKLRHKGFVGIDVLMVIPFLLYFSKSVIRTADTENPGMALYSMHITPFFSLSFTWRNS